MLVRLRAARRRAAERRALTQEATASFDALGPELAAATGRAWLRQPADESDGDVWHAEDGGVTCRIGIGEGAWELLIECDPPEDVLPRPWPTIVGFLADGDTTNLFVHGEVDSASMLESRLVARRESFDSPPDSYMVQVDPERLRTPISIEPGEPVGETAARIAGLTARWQRFLVQAQSIYRR